MSRDKVKVISTRVENVDCICDLDTNEVNNAGFFKLHFVNKNADTLICNLTDLLDWICVKRRESEEMEELYDVLESLHIFNHDLLKE